MSKRELVLYIFDGNELEEVVTGLPRIKKYLKEYENNTERGAKKVERTGRKT